MISKRASHREEPVDNQPVPLSEFAAFDFGLKAKPSVTPIPMKSQFAAFDFGLKAKLGLATKPKANKFAAFDFGLKAKHVSNALYGDVSLPPLILDSRQSWLIGRVLVAVSLPPLILDSRQSNGEAAVVKTRSLPPLILDSRQSASMDWASLGRFRVTVRISTCQRLAIGGILGG